MRTFIEWLEDALLIEQAYKRKKAIDDISSYEDPLIRHIIMLVVDPKNPARNHWEGEVDAFLTKIERSMRLKGGTKLKHAKLHELLIGDPLESYEDYKLFIRGINRIEDSDYTATEGDYRTTLKIMNTIVNQLDNNTLEKIRNYI